LVGFSDHINLLIMFEVVLATSYANTKTGCKIPEEGACPFYLKWGHVSVRAVNHNGLSNSSQISQLRAKYLPAITAWTSFNPHLYSTSHCQHALQKWYLNTIDGFHSIFHHRNWRAKVSCDVDIN